MPWLGSRSRPTRDSRGGILQPEQPGVHQPSKLIESEVVGRLEFRVGAAVCDAMLRHVQSALERGVSHL